MSTTNTAPAAAPASTRGRESGADELDYRPGGLKRTPYSFVVLILLALFAALPIFVLLFNSFKSNAELGSNPLGFPQSWDFSNFATAWTLGRLGQGLLNS